MIYKSCKNIFTNLYKILNWLHFWFALYFKPECIKRRSFYHKIKLLAECTQEFLIIILNADPECYFRLQNYHYFLFSLTSTIPETSIILQMSGLCKVKSKKWNCSCVEFCWAYTTYTLSDISHFLTSAEVCMTTRGSDLCKASWRRRTDSFPFLCVALDWKSKALIA